MDNKEGVLKPSGDARTQGAPVISVPSPSPPLSLTKPTHFSQNLGVQHANDTSRIPTPIAESVEERQQMSSPPPSAIIHPPSMHTTTTSTKAKISLRRDRYPVRQDLLLDSAAPTAIHDVLRFAGRKEDGATMAVEKTGSVRIEEAAGSVCGTERASDDFFSLCASQGPQVKDERKRKRSLDDGSVPLSSVAGGSSLLEQEMTTVQLYGLPHLTLTSHQHRHHHYVPSPYGYAPECFIGEGNPERKKAPLTSALVDVVGASIMGGSHTASVQVRRCPTATECRETFTVAGRFHQPLSGHAGEGSPFGMDTRMAPVCAPPLSFCASPPIHGATITVQRGGRHQRRTTRKEGNASGEDPPPVIDTASTPTPADEARGGGGGGGREHTTTPSSRGRASCRWSYRVRSRNGPTSHAPPSVPADEVVHGEAAQDDTDGRVPPEDAAAPPPLSERPATRPTRVAMTTVLPVSRPTTKDPPRTRPASRTLHWRFLTEEALRARSPTLARHSSVMATREDTAPPKARLASARHRTGSRASGTPLMRMGNTCVDRRPSTTTSSHTFRHGVGKRQSDTTSAVKGRGGDGLPPRGRLSDGPTRPPPPRATPFLSSSSSSPSVEGELPEEGAKKGDVHVWHPLPETRRVSQADVSDTHSPSSPTILLLYPTCTSTEREGERNASGDNGPSMSRVECLSTETEVSSSATAKGGGRERKGRPFAASPTPPLSLQVVPSLYGTRGGGIHLPASASTAAKSPVIPLPLSVPQVEAIDQTVPGNATVVLSSSSDPCGSSSPAVAGMGQDGCPPEYDHHPRSSTFPEETEEESTLHATREAGIPWTAEKAPTEGAAVHKIALPTPLGVEDARDHGGIASRPASLGPSAATSSASGDRSRRVVLSPPTADAVVLPPFMVVALQQAHRMMTTKGEIPGRPLSSSSSSFSARAGRRLPPSRGGGRGDTSVLRHGGGRTPKKWHPPVGMTDGRVEAGTPTGHTTMNGSARHRPPTRDRKAMDVVEEEGTTPTTEATPSPAAAVADLPRTVEALHITRSLHHCPPRIPSEREVCFLRAAAALHGQTLSVSPLRMECIPPPDESAMLLSPPSPVEARAFSATDAAAMRKACAALSRVEREEKMQPFQMAKRLLAEPHLSLPTDTRPRADDVALEKKQKRRDQWILNTIAQFCPEEEETEEEEDEEEKQDIHEAYKRGEEGGARSGFRMAPVMPSSSSKKAGDKSGRQETASRQTSSNAGGGKGHPAGLPPFASVPHSPMEEWGTASGTAMHRPRETAKRSPSGGGGGGGSCSAAAAAGGKGTNTPLRSSVHSLPDLLSFSSKSFTKMPEVDGREKKGPFASGTAGRRGSAKATPVPRPFPKHFPAAFHAFLDRARFPSPAPPPLPEVEDEEEEREASSRGGVNSAARPTTATTTSSRSAPWATRDGRHSHPTRRRSSSGVLARKKCRSCSTSSAEKDKTPVVSTRGCPRLSEVGAGFFTGLLPLHTRHSLCDMEDDWNEKSNKKRNVRFTLKDIKAFSNRGMHTHLDRLCAALTAPESALAALLQPPGWDTVMPTPPVHRRSGSVSALLSRPHRRFPTIHANAPAELLPTTVAHRSRSPSLFYPDSAARNRKTSGGEWKEKDSSAADMEERASSIFHGYRASLRSTSSHAFPRPRSVSMRSTSTSSVLQDAEPNTMERRHTKERRERPSITSTAGSLPEAYRLGEISNLFLELLEDAAIAGNLPLDERLRVIDIHAAFQEQRLQQEYQQMHPVMDVTPSPMDVHWASEVRRQKSEKSRKWEADLAASRATQKRLQGKAKQNATKEKEWNGGRWCSEHDTSQPPSSSTGTKNSRPAAPTTRGKQKAVRSKTHRERVTASGHHPPHPQTAHPRRQQQQASSHPLPVPSAAVTSSSSTSPSTAHASGYVQALLDRHIPVNPLFPIQAAWEREERRIRQQEGLLDYLRQHARTASTTTITHSHPSLLALRSATAGTTSQKEVAAGAASAIGVSSLLHRGRSVAAGERDLLASATIMDSGMLSDMVVGANPASSLPPSLVDPEAAQHFRSQSMSNPLLSSVRPSSKAATVSFSPPQHTGEVDGEEVRGGGGVALVLPNHSGASFGAGTSEEEEIEEEDDEEWHRDRTAGDKKDLQEEFSTLRRRTSTVLLSRRLSLPTRSISASFHRNQRKLMLIVDRRGQVVPPPPPPMALYLHSSTLPVPPASSQSPTALAPLSLTRLTDASSGCSSEIVKGKSIPPLSSPPPSPGEERIGTTLSSTPCTIGQIDERRLGSRRASASRKGSHTSDRLLRRSSAKEVYHSMDTSNLSFSSHNPSRRANSFSSASHRSPHRSFSLPSRASSHTTVEKEEAEAEAEGWRRKADEPPRGGSSEETPIGSLWEAQEGEATDLPLTFTPTATAPLPSPSVPEKIERVALLPTPSPTTAPPLPSPTRGTGEAGEGRQDAPTTSPLPFPPRKEKETATESEEWGEQRAAVASPSLPTDAFPFSRSPPFSPLQCVPPLADGEAALPPSSGCVRPPFALSPEEQPFHPLRSSSLVESPPRLSPAPSTEASMLQGEGPLSTTHVGVEAKGERAHTTLVSPTTDTTPENAMLEDPSTTPLAARQEKGFSTTGGGAEGGRALAVSSPTTVGPPPNGKFVRRVEAAAAGGGGPPPPSVPPFSRRAFSGVSLFTPHTSVLSSHRGGAGGRRLHHFSPSIADNRTARTEVEAIGAEGEDLSGMTALPPTATSSMPPWQERQELAMAPRWDEVFPHMNLLFAYHDVAVTEMALLMTPDED